MRKLLRRRHGIDRGIPVVLSTEKPRCKLVDMSGGGNLSDFQVSSSCLVLRLWLASCRVPVKPLRGNSLQRGQLGV